MQGLSLHSAQDFTLENGGATLLLGAGGLRAAAPDAQSRLYTVEAALRLEADQRWGVTNNGPVATTLHVSGPVSQGAANAGISKQGDGLLVLAGSNSYAGVTTVVSGGLRVQHSHALGATNGATVLAAGAWLETAGVATLREPLTLPGDLADGTLRAVSGSNTWAGRITQTAASRISARSGSRLTLSGGISGSTAVYLSPDAGAEVAVSGDSVLLGTSGRIYANGAGVVSFGATNNTFGTLDVAGLNFRLTATNAIPPAAIINIGSSFDTGGLLDLNGFDMTCSQIRRGLATAGDRRVTASAPATLTVSGSTSPTYDGTFSGHLSLVKSGSSTLFLTGGANSQTGSVTVTAGTLDVYASANLGASTNITVSGGTLRLRGSEALPTPAALRISGSGRVRLDAGTQQTVSRLYLNGVRARRGSWGSTSSVATHTDDTFFSTVGSGVLHVLHGPVCVLLIQ